VGAFLPDPLDAPDEIVIYLAKQLDIDTIDQLSRYNERRSTRFEHQDEIRVALGLTDFSAQVEAFTVWLDALAFTTGDGPHALFAAAVDYLRGHRVLPELAGVMPVVHLYRVCGASRGNYLIARIISRRQLRMHGHRRPRGCAHPPWHDG
jgi:Domain of unknown function (DUF4158)